MKKTVPTMVMTAPATIGDVDDDANHQGEDEDPNDDGARDIDKADDRNDDYRDHLTMLHLLHGPDYASRTSPVPSRQHLGCTRVEVTLGADRIGPG